MRELNFGEHEGLHYDNLSETEKQRFSSPDFQAAGGESWADVTQRAKTYLTALESGQNHLIFTHGGLMAAYVNTYFKDEMPEMPPNASLIGMHLKQDGSGEPDSFDFRWDFPYIEEDI